MFKTRHCIAELIREIQQIRKYKRNGWHYEARAVQRRCVRRILVLLIIFSITLGICCAVLCLVLNQQVFRLAKDAEAAKETIIRHPHFFILPIPSGMGA